MARLQQVKLTIKTGAAGLSGPVRIRINGRVVPLLQRAGGTQSGQTYEGSLDVHSVVHSLELMGPPAGSWTVEWLHAWFVMDVGDPYGHELGMLSLEANEGVNIWSAGETFSV